MPATRRGRDREIRRNERRRRRGIGVNPTLPEDMTPGGGGGLPGGGAPGGGAPGGGTPGGGATPGVAPAPPTPGTPAAPTGAGRGTSALSRLLRRTGNRLLGN